MKYVTLHKVESWGSIGGFGIEVLVAADNLPSLDKDCIQSAAYKAVKNISGEICAEIKLNDPKTHSEVNRNRDILDIFSEPIFIEERPNGYCSDWCRRCGCLKIYDSLFDCYRYFYPKTER